MKRDSSFFSAEVYFSYGVLFGSKLQAVHDEHTKQKAWLVKYENYVFSAASALKYVLGSNKKAVAIKEDGI